MRRSALAEKIGSHAARPVAVSALKATIDTTRQLAAEVWVVPLAPMCPTKSIEVLYGIKITGAEGVAAIGEGLRVDESLVFGKFDDTVLVAVVHQRGVVIVAYFDSFKFGLSQCRQLNAMLFPIISLMFVQDSHCMHHLMQHTRNSRLVVGARVLRIRQLYELPSDSLKAYVCLGHCVITLHKSDRKVKFFVLRKFAKALIVVIPLFDGILDHVEEFGVFGDFGLDAVSDNPFGPEAATPLADLAHEGLDVIGGGGGR